MDFVQAHRGFLQLYQVNIYRDYLFQNNRWIKTNTEQEFNQPRSFGWTHPSHKEIHISACKTPGLSLESLLILAAQLSISWCGDVFPAAAEFLLHLLLWFEELWWLPCKGHGWCFQGALLCFGLSRDQILPLGSAGVHFSSQNKIALEIKTFYIKDYLIYLFAADNQRCSWFIDIF